jgi:hypothetical protein
MASSGSDVGDEAGEIQGEDDGIDRFKSGDGHPDRRQDHPCAPVEEEPREITSRCAGGGYQGGDESEEEKRDGDDGGEPGRASEAPQ